MTKISKNSKNKFHRSLTHHSSGIQALLLVGSRDIWAIHGFCFAYKFLIRVFSIQPVFYDARTHRRIFFFCREYSPRTALYYFKTDFFLVRFRARNGRWASAWRRFFRYIPRSYGQRHSARKPTGQPAYEATSGVVLLVCRDRQENESEQLWREWRHSLAEGHSVRGTARTNWRIWIFHMFWNDS